MGGMLVDDDQTVFSLRDNIGRGDLAAGDSEREAWNWLDRRFGASGGRLVKELLFFSESGRSSEGGRPVRSLSVPDFPGMTR